MILLGSLTQLAAQLNWWILLVRLPLGFCGLTQLLGSSTQ
jgi:hypothetical protein